MSPPPKCNVVRPPKTIEFDAPVTDCWLEFAQAGEEKVLIRCILPHTCGGRTSWRVAKALNGLTRH